MREKGEKRLGNVELLGSLLETVLGLQGMRRDGYAIVF